MSDDNVATEASEAEAGMEVEAREPAASVACLIETLGDAALETSHTFVGEDETKSWIRVAASNWANCGATAKDCGFTYFSFLSGLDWLDNPELNGEKTFVADHVAKPTSLIDDPVIRKAGGTSRFQVLARVSNPSTLDSVFFVADLDDNEPAVETWTKLFLGAQWHERETSEMFGFDFVGNADLRHIYLSDEFAGNPLRKDFALAARLVRPWPGLVDMEEMPSVEAADATNEGGVDK